MFTQNDSAKQPNELESEIFHWELSQRYKHSMICPSQMGDRWMANYAAWDGSLIEFSRVSYSSADAAIAAAKAEIDQRDEQIDFTGEIFHWELASYYRGHLICPSLFEDGWFANYFDWIGLVENWEEEEFSTADDAIAAAKPMIDTEIIGWIKNGPVQGVRDLHQLGVIQLPEA